MQSNSFKNSLKRFFPPVESSKSRKKGKNVSIAEVQESSSDSDHSNGEQSATKRSHERKESDSNWFKFYPWLDKQVIDGKITLFCSLCRERKGKTIFATGTTKYRLEKIKNHIKTSEHRESEDLAKPQQLKISYQFCKTAWDRQIKYYFTYEKCLFLF